MIYLLLLLSALGSASSTNLYLSSVKQPRKKIPTLKFHTHSCELVYYKIHQNLLNVSITEIPQYITESKITFIFNLDSLKNPQQTQTVDNRAVQFSFNFSQYKELVFNDSMQLNVGIDVQFNGRDSFIEKRRGYLIFTKSGQQFYKIKLPLMAIIVTQLIGLICIILLPLNVRYRKFLPFTFNIYTCVIYILILVIALYLQMLFPTQDIIFTIQKIVVAIFSYICLVLYTQDLLYFVLQKNVLIWVLSICMATAIIVCDELVPQLQDAWFLNNVVAIMVAGAFIKFVIIRRLKTAIWAIALMWVFSLLRQFAIHFQIQEYDQGVGIRIVPLFLQIPKIELFDDFADYACSAFGSSKIISFGVILNYCKRVDLSLSTHFYRILGCTIASFCVIFQLGYNIIFNDYPTMEVMSVIVFYPLIVILMLFFAEKRGQWAQIWHGSFYDMAVNRASIPRSISFQELGRSFGQDLLLNKGSIQND